MQMMGGLNTPDIDREAGWAKGLAFGWETLNRPQKTAVVKHFCQQTGWNSITRFSLSIRWWWNLSRMKLTWGWWHLLAAATTGAPDSGTVVEVPHPGQPEKAIQVNRRGVRYIGMLFYKGTRIATASTCFGSEWPQAVNFNGGVCSTGMNISKKKTTPTEGGGQKSSKEKNKWGRDTGVIEAQEEYIAHKSPRSCAYEPKEVKRANAVVRRLLVTRCVATISTYLSMANRFSQILFYCWTRWPPGWTGDLVEACRLDFRKAFDSVHHIMLLNKLGPSDVTPSATRWSAD